MSSGDSTPVLTVTTDDAAGTSIPSPYLLQADVSMWATFVQVIQQEFCGDFFFFFFGYAAIWNSRALHWPHSWEGFLICGNFSSFTTPSPGWVSVPKCFFSLIIFIFFPHFKEIGLPFWVTGVFHQCSEVVLWKLLHMQMIFWYICGRESDLPILFLHHLGTAPHPPVISYDPLYFCGVSWNNYFFISDFIDLGRPFFVWWV